MPPKPKPEPPATPEHIKLKAVADKSQAIHDFLEWLADGQYNEDVGPVELAYRPYMTEKPIYKRKRGEMFPEIVGYEPIPREEWKRQGQLESLTYQMSPLLAKFFDIDLKKIDDEKRALLDFQRELNEQ